MFAVEFGRVLISLSQCKEFPFVIKIADEADSGRLAARMVKNLKCIEKAWFPVP